MNRFVYCPGGVVVFYRPKNSMLGPLPGVNQGSTYVPFSALGFLFVLFLLPDFSQKKDMYKSLSPPSGIDSALRSCVTKREK